MKATLLVFLVVCVLLTIPEAWYHVRNWWRDVFEVEEE